MYYKSSTFKIANGGGMKSRRRRHHLQQEQLQELNAVFTAAPMLL
jgi:hypothetical protein